MKKKLKQIRDFVYEHRTFSYPLILMIAVAVTAFFALTYGGKEETDQQKDSLESLVSSSSGQPEIPEEVKDTRLKLSDNEQLNELFRVYYDAYADGRLDEIRDISNYLSDTDALVITEMSKYIISYPTIEAYIQPGPLPDSYLAYVYVKMLIEGYPEEEMPGLERFYVCTDENGKLYLNKSEVVSDEEMEYINHMSTMDDVVELGNRVEAEFNDVAMNNAEMIYYVQEVAAEVKNSVGTILAQNHAGEDEDPENPDENGGDAGTEDPDETQPSDGGGEVSVPMFATATTTVNIRKSDSEKSEKIGKVQKGTKVELVEQKVNGWSHIRYDNLDGYIKSEFLSVAEKIDKSQVIGQVTATTNVNVRQLPDQNSEKLGIISGGESIDLLERKDGWCKISYNGRVGYIKEDYVQE